MADPLSILGAITALGATAAGAVRFFSFIANAPETVTQLERDVTFTLSLVELLRNELPEEIQNVSNVTNGAAPIISGHRLLRTAIEQLESDVSAVQTALRSLPRSKAEPQQGSRAKAGASRWIIDQSTLQLRLPTLKARRADLQRSQGQLQTVLYAVAHSTLIRSNTGEDQPLPLPDHEPPNADVYEEFFQAVKERRRADVESYIQRRKVSPNTPQVVSKTSIYPLIMASKNGDNLMIELMVKSGAKLDCTASNHKTPLIYALENNKGTAATRLIELGIDAQRNNPKHPGAGINHADEDGRTALHVAAKKNMYSITQILLEEGANPDRSSAGGYTPLMEAVLREDRKERPHSTNVLRVLLEPGHNHKGANPALATSKEKREATAIHIAACHGFIEDLKVLVETPRTKALNACDRLDVFNRSALWLAAEGGHVEAVRVLVESTRKEIINHISLVAEKPTSIWAAMSDDPEKSADVLEIVSILIAKDADAKITDVEGRTIVHRVCELGYADVLDVLLTTDVDPFAPENPKISGKQPLHIAATKGHAACVNSLLTRDPSQVDTDDNEGTTPLILAAANGHDFLLRPLVATFGANLHHKNTYKCDAFYTASYRGQILCAAVLLGLGADINTRERRQSTPLHAAVRMGNLEMVCFLLRHGAEKSLRSEEPFDGMNVIGTAADVAKSIRFQGKEGLAKRIADVIETWDARRRFEFLWDVTVRDKAMPKDEAGLTRRPSHKLQSKAATPSPVQTPATPVGSPPPPYHKQTGSSSILRAQTGLLSRPTKSEGGTSGTSLS